MSVLTALLECCLHGSPSSFMRAEIIHCTVCLICHTYNRMATAALIGVEYAANKAFDQRRCHPVSIVQSTCSPGICLRQIKCMFITAYRNRRYVCGWYPFQWIYKCLLYGEYAVNCRCPRGLYGSRLKSGRTLHASLHFVLYVTMQLLKLYSFSYSSGTESHWTNSKGQNPARQNPTVQNPINCITLQQAYL